MRFHSGTLGWFNLGVGRCWWRFRERVLNRNRMFLEGAEALVFLRIYFGRSLFMRLTEIGIAGSRINRRFCDYVISVGAIILTFQPNPLGMAPANDFHHLKRGRINGLSRNLLLDAAGG